MMKKLALIPFMLSMAFAGQSQAALTDGVYETTVNGHNAPMTVKVTIKDHKIAAIDASKNLESFGVGKVGRGLVEDRDRSSCLSLFRSRAQNQ